MAKLTREICEARAQALEECADHLDLEWTDDPVERRAGAWLGAKLRAEAEHWSARAASLARVATRCSGNLPWERASLAMPTRKSTPSDPQQAQPARAQASPASPMSAGAERALMRMTLANSMDPSTDLHGAAGPYGRVLVARGLAVRDGIDGYTKLKLFKVTEAGREEGLRLLRATAGTERHTRATNSEGGST